MSTAAYRFTAGALALAAVSAGCTYVNHNYKEPAQQVPTVGRELADLKIARDAGAIDAVQYEAAKQRLLARMCR